MCVGCVNFYSRVQLCSQKYSPSAQVVYSSTAVEKQLLGLPGSALEVSVGGGVVV